MRTQSDRVLIAATLALLLIGLLMVYSASAVLAARQYGDAFLFLKKQILWVSIGVVAMMIVSKIPYQRLRSAAFPMLLGAVILLMAVLIPSVGMEINGSRRWIGWGFFSMQPSELAKICMVVYLAGYLAKRKDHLHNFSRGFLPPLLTVGLLLSLIIAEPDFGTVAVMAVIAGTMLFVGGVRLNHLWAIGIIAIPFAYALVAKSGYRRERLLAFLDPWKDPTDGGFQIIQSFLAMGQGGAMGQGLGEGRQKLFFLPYPHTDFIFAVIGEELGLIGTLFVLTLFAVVAWRGMRIALSAPDLFGRYLGFGITLMIVFQAQVNMAVVTGLLPTKGLTLPLLSYGGSSLLINMIGIGVLLNLAEFRHRKGQQHTERTRTPKRLSFLNLYGRVS